VKRENEASAGIEATLAERGKDYGEFIDNAKVSQVLKEVAKSGRRYNACAFDQKEALDMICAKISRLVTGNPDHLDSWVDISGYATLVANRLRRGVA
jgi:hypothetical protein